MNQIERGTHVRVYWSRQFGGPTCPAGLEEGSEGVIADYSDGFYREDFDSEGRPMYEVEFEGYGPGGRPGPFMVWHSQLEAVA